MLVEQDTKRYYSRKSTDWLSEMGAAAYIGHIDTVMGQEDHRCTAYLNPVTRPKLARALLETCIVAHRDTLFEAAKEILSAAYDNSQVGFRVITLRMCGAVSGILRCYMYTILFVIPIENVLVIFKIALVI
jgi:hypothetical protein